MVLRSIAVGADFERSISEAVEALKNLSKNSTDQERYVFARWCIANDLDPWKSEAFLIVRGEGDRRSVTHQIAYEILLQRAEGTEGYGGFQAGIIVVDRQSNVVEDLIGSFYLPETQELVGAWCNVDRAGREPLQVRVMLTEFQQTRWDRDKGERVPMARWATAPASQILKCAVAEGHRRAFQPARREDVRFEALEASTTEAEALAAPEENPAAALYDSADQPAARVDEATGEILDTPKPAARRAPLRNASPPVMEPQRFANLGDFLNHWNREGMSRRQIEEVTGALTSESDLMEAHRKLKAALEPPPEDRDDQQVATRDRDESRQGS